MSPGDTVVLYTDGISEAENEAAKSSALSGFASSLRNSNIAARPNW